MPGGSIAQLVNRTARLLNAIGDVRLRRFGFRYAQVPVLAALRQTAGLTQADLAEKTGVEQSSMAQLLARMERDGMIERTVDPDDARRRLIRLTTETSRRAHTAHGALQALDEEAVADLTASELRTLKSLLQRVHDNLEALAR